MHEKTPASSFRLPFFGAAVVAALLWGLAGNAVAGDTKVMRIVFFGDSLTSGYGIDPDETYPALIQKKIERRGWPFQSMNAGVSGETTAGGVRRIDWVLRQPVDVFVLALGGNDGLRGLPVDSTAENLREIFNRVRTRHPDAVLVLAGMRMPPNMGETYIREFAGLFPKLAAETEALLIPFFLEGVGGVPEMNLPDGIHPTAEGHKVMAETVWKSIEPALRRRVAEGRGQ